ncbi:MAG: AAA family ATPase [Polyangiales bacterium]
MPLVFEHYTFDEVHRELRRGSQLVKADPRHLDLLEVFLQNPGVLLSRQQIIDEVWEGRAVGSSVLSVAVAKLRKVLGKRAQHEYIESRYGRGYRFLPDVKRVGSEDVTATPPPLRVQEVAGRAPLVGRRAALEQLTAAAESAQLGFGSLCMLSGEAGIGKTRLAEALERLLFERGDFVSAIWARCQPEASSPLGPVRRVMRELVKQGLVEGSAAEVAQEAELATDPGPLDDASRRLFGTLSRTTHIDTPTLDALAQRLLDISRGKTLVLLFDDIQWADSASLQLLASMTDEIARWPVLLVCTLRSGEPAGETQRALARLWNHRHCHRIELSRLSASDVDEYVQALYGDGTAALSQMLFTRSEGNPFFMVDLLRSVDGAAPAHTVPWQLSGLALEAVRQRLRDLPARAHQVLTAAAVLGHDFDLGVLSHVINCHPEEILEALTESLQNETVIASTTKVGLFAFEHELIREALYGELPAAERGKLHWRAASGLQQRRAAGGEVTHAELAHHFLSAQPHGDIKVAIAHAQAAAADALRLSSPVSARDMLRRALEVLRFWIAPPPETRAALLLQLAMVERILGDPAYRAHLSQAVSLAREHRLGDMLTHAVHVLCPSPGLVAHAEAGPVLEAACEILAPDDYKNLAIVHAHLAWTPPHCHSARRVEQLLERAQHFSEQVDSPVARAAIRDARMFFSAGPRTADTSEAIAREIELECDARPDAPQARRMLVAGFRLTWAMQRGDRAALQRAIDARQALLPRLNNVELRWHHERMLLVHRMNEGDFAQIKDDLIKLRERASRFELHASQMLWALDYGVFLSRTGDTSAVAARVGPALKLTATDSPMVWGRKIRSMVDFGLIDAVHEAMANVSIDALDDLPHDREYLAVLCQLAAGAAAAESSAHCEALYRLLEPYADYYAVGVSFHAEGSVATHLGVLSEALGDPKRARQHYERGLKQERAFALVPCAAVTGYRLAQLYLHKLGERQRARRILERVGNEAERMGMQPLARAAREALGADTPLQQA